MRKFAAALTAAGVTMAMVVAANAVADDGVPPGEVTLTICHAPYSHEQTTITVPLITFFLAHAAHGDYIGECQASEHPPTDPGPPAP